MLKGTLWDSERGERREVHNEELPDLCSLPIVMLATKSRTVIGMGGSSGIKTMNVEHIWNRRPQNMRPHMKDWPLKREAETVSEIWVNFYRRSWRHIADHTAGQHCTALLACLVAAAQTAHNKIVSFRLNTTAYNHQHPSMATCFGSFWPIFRPIFSSRRYNRHALYIMGSHTVYRVCVKTIIKDFLV